MDDYELNSVGNLTEDELMHMFSQPLNSEYRNAEEYILLCFKVEIFFLF